jgi:2-methylcitrate dehydratase PrpD
MTYPITAELGRFVAGIHDAAIPEAAFENARMGFADCVAVMIAGRAEEAPRLLDATLAPPPGAATLYLPGRTAPAPEAALINGCAAHALDFDDVAVGGHPSTVFVPAIMAEAEHLGLSGEAMLRAYVAGYEAWAELSLRERGSLHAKGWHPTGIWGAVGAAAACAALRGLDAEKATMAVALGASMSAGIMANFGTMTKPFHAGRAAHAGVMAARLAEAGFTASPDAIEHPQGLLSAVSPRGETDRAARGLGERWQLVENGLNIKKFPMCYCAHRAIDSLLTLRQSRCLDPDDIAGITAHIGERFTTVLRNHAPKTGLEAKFSAEFAMASAAIRGRVSLLELQDDFVMQPEVQAMMGRVEVAKKPDDDPDHPNQARAEHVTVTLHSGEVLNGPEVQHARGHAAAPLTRRELFEKFESCIDYAGADDVVATDLFERLMSMGDTPARGMLAA